MVAWLFAFSINKYRGLSGNHGNSISWIAVGNTTRDKSRGQYSSCGGEKTFSKVCKEAILYLTFFKVNLNQGKYNESVLICFSAFTGSLHLVQLTITD